LFYPPPSLADPRRGDADFRGEALTAPTSPASARPSLIARLVAVCCDHALVVVALGVLLGVGSGWFAATHFAMTTDTDKLISNKVPYQQRGAAFDADFPPQRGRIVAVVDGQTPELAEEAAASLAARLSARPDVFHWVTRPDSGPFWSREGLLYASLDDVKSTTAQMIKAQPFLGPLAADPSLRGLMGSLSTALKGVTSGQASLADIDRPMRSIADALDQLQAGKPTFFSWRAMITGKPPDPDELRHVILIDPQLDFTRLKPGAQPTELIRQSVKDLQLDPAHGVRVRLTGPVPLQDEEFGTLAERAGLIATLALSAILLMLWFAVRSPRVIVCILLTTFMGLATTAALGLIAFGRFNAISVAFVPLFVGLGVDFGIQFSVRYRAEHVTGRPIREALVASGQGMGRALTLAAAAIACGFLAFAPTAYIGLAQLGVIAGFGMLIALALNLTLLPALLKVAHPSGCQPEATAGALVAVDAYVLGHRRLVIGTALAVAAVCAALMPLLHFDFNPMHLRSTKVESVSTLLDLMRDPNQSPNTLELLRPNLASAGQTAAQLAKLPEVYGARTLSSFIPGDQPEKLSVINDASTLLGFTLDPLVTAPPPSDAETVQSLTQTAADLRTAAGSDSSGPAQDARRLAGDLERLAKASPAARAQAENVLMPGLKTVLDQMNNVLQAQPITMQTLPKDLVSQWIGFDGRARVSVIPRGDSNNNAVLRRFIDAVSAEAPDATGTPVGILEGGRVVVGAFIEAGVLSFIAITILLFIVLRRVRDVAITMAPIVLTGLLTLGTCVLIGQSLNFANIIALPLLFGIGVAFHIYFVMAWRSGGSHLLQSSLTRAIFFSAMTTATGFGSLWASSHPGTASMGKLLMISLVWTLVSALLFQPALMGPPRHEVGRAR
jgi:hopanoid biosynthesis associated RND transporter like protein HpnN